MLILLLLTIVIQDVTVIDPLAQASSVHQDVVIDGRKIQSIRHTSAAKDPNALTIAGSGKFLIPGLWDAHVHLSKTGSLSLALFLANGVTSVRDMGSNFEEVAAWREKIERGSLPGPHIRTSGPMIESESNIERMKREATVEPVDRLRLGVRNPAEGRAAVDRLANQGVDHIKMRTTPDLATFQAVAQEAGARGLPLAVHPLESPDELLRSRVRSVEHFLTYPALPPNRTTAALFARVAASGTFFSNTMVNIPALESTVGQARARLADREGKADPLRKYVCGYLVEDWREQAAELKDYPASFRVDMEAEYANFQAMRKAGVPMLAGTDAAVLFMYPGFSLHDELRLLVEQVGYTPMEVLRIATHNPHEFYREDRLRGSLRAGQAADLVMLDADPARDIRNTTKISGVMFAGKWRDRKALDSLLENVALKARTDCGR